MFRCLFSTMVKTHLEYTIPILSAQRQNCITKLEDVQRRATRKVLGLRHLSYEDCLRRLEMPTVAYRGLLGIIIEKLKILNPSIGHEICQRLPYRADTTPGRGVTAIQRKIV